MQFLAASIHNSDIHDKTKDIETLLSLDAKDFEDMTKQEMLFAIHIICVEIKTLRDVLEV